MRFAPDWLSLVPLVRGNYWVIDLDQDYQLVAVGEPERNYLWVLSRMPKVAQRTYEELLARWSPRALTSPDCGPRLRSPDHFRGHPQVRAGGYGRLPWLMDGSS